MSLDAYMDAFGRELRQAASRKRPTRRRLAVALPTAAALTAVGVIALPRGDGVDAIALARQALAPGDEIVHMVIQFKPPNAGTSGFALPKSEQWYAAGLKRWRTRSEMPARAAGRRAGDFEQIYVNDSLRVYDKRRDVVTIMRGIKLVVPGAPAGPGVAGGDPATELRKQLEAGDLRDDGVVTRDGRQVRRLVREQRIGKRMAQRFVYYMDPQTFAPLGGRMYFKLGGRPTAMSEFVISEYERIPLNDENMQLLRFQKTDATKYVWRDATRPKPAKRAR